MRIGTARQKRKKGIYNMKVTTRILSAAVVGVLSLAPNVFSQAASPQPAAAASDSQQTNQPATTDSQQTNIQAYIELLRSNVQTAKTAVLTQTMNLNDAQAAKFWPIYREYNFELQKLNDKKIAGIQDYANNYDSMTDTKANELALTALDLESQRTALKRKYYEKMNSALGGVVAARFLQVENQLLMIIDLQIASQLPIVTKAPQNQ
jgi:hypothetical protein